MEETTIDLAAEPGTELHLHLHPEPGVHIRINITAPVGRPPVQEKPQEPPTAVAAALARLERTGSPHVREVADGLMAMGYVLAPWFPAMKAHSRRTTRA